MISINDLFNSLKNALERGDAKGTIVAASNLAECAYNDPLDAPASLWMDICLCAWDAMPVGMSNGPVKDSLYALWNAAHSAVSITTTE